MFAGYAVGAIEERHIGGADSFGLCYFFVCDRYVLQSKVLILHVVVLESKSVCIRNNSNFQADLLLETIVLFNCTTYADVSIEERSLVGAVVHGQLLISDAVLDLMDSHSSRLHVVFAGKQKRHVCD